MNNTFIACDNLVRIYKVANLEVVALQGLNLSVSAGEMVGVIGVSGSGKSTLLNVLGGLDRPSAGRAWVDGKDLLKLSQIELDRFRRDTVGFVWQQSSRNLIPFLSAIENVQMPVNLTSGLSKETEEYCEYLLESVGIADRMNHNLSELSGGQQQRVAIAVALANRPKLLLADEPTGEVDRQTASDIYEIINQLNENFGMTTMIVSHDPLIARYVDRVVAIRDGQLASETIRQKKHTDRDHQLSDQSDAGEEENYDELIVLDSTGRLQLPKELLEQKGLRHRVRVEEVEDGILIKAVEDIQYNEENNQIEEDPDDGPPQLNLLSKKIKSGIETFTEKLKSLNTKKGGR